MSRRFQQLGFGLAIGIAVRFFSPEHDLAGYAAAGVLSLIGAAAGSAMAEAFLPQDVMGQGSYALSGLGAIAMLLIQAIVVR